jgi:iron complex outermembrane receptor protein
VAEGPSSTLYGNYATGGAINFHTRTGSEIQGFELGADFGSFGYFNDYAAYGVGEERYQISAFVSNVRADQATANNQFNTITGNLLAAFAATPRDRFTIKFIDNDLDAKLSIRLSLAQYRLNPFQKGCEVYSAAPATNGCASVSLFTNGYNGSRVSQTAAQAGLGRHDRRTIFGARYEHDLTDNLTWRTQFVFDNRDANQPTSSTTYRGTLPSFNVVSDVLRRGNLWNRRSASYAGGFFNYENINSYSSNVVPVGGARLGGQTQTVFGKHLNTGARARQELALAERWTIVAGLGMEFTGLNALANNFIYPTAATPVVSPVSADRTFFNVAPEVSVQYHPSDMLRLHARLGIGYGTPQATQLFVNAQGAFGNNTTLKTQRNTGVDLGADWSLGSTLQASVTGFYEWFHNEMVTQSPGVNLQSYTFNAPASAHRGVEVGLDWHPLPIVLSGARLRVSYMFDDQVYTEYSESLTTGTQTGRFNRSGNKIPGVVPTTPIY